MLIKGLIKSSLVDYPGNIVCTIFLGGCNFKCGFCYNPELVIDINNTINLKEENILKFLDTRKGKLDGVCIIGGEPLINKDLPEFLKKIKDKGFLVKVDTNGSHPEMLKQLIKNKLVDYVSMDIKSSKKNYKQFFDKKDYIQNVENSVELLKNSNINYEFRTTIVPSIINETEMKQICEWIKGAKKYYLQQFDNRHKTIDPKFFKIKLYTPDQIKKFQTLAKKYVQKCEIRNI
ncbi:MAG: anaerobic ribonucleoside-triphosphate reductase activating protein [archaeon]